MYSDPCIISSLPAVRLHFRGLAGFWPRLRVLAAVVVVVVVVRNLG